MDDEAVDVEAVVQVTFDCGQNDELFVPVESKKEEFIEALIESCEGVLDIDEQATEEEEVEVLGCV